MVRGKFLNAGFRANVQEGPSRPAEVDRLQRPNIGLQLRKDTDLVRLRRPITVQ